MELLADVHVKSAFVTALQNEGHDVRRVVDTDPLGGTATDSEILEYAAERKTVVLTNDAKDFTRTERHAGVIIVPQEGITPGEMAAAVSRIERLVPDLQGTVLYATDWTS